MKQVEIMKDKNYQINKNEKLLLSEYKLSVQSLKIMSCLICMIRQDDEDFSEYVFSSKEFKKLIGSKNKNTIQEMLRSADELLNTKIKLTMEKKFY